MLNILASLYCIADFTPMGLPYAIGLEGLEPGCKSEIMQLASCVAASDSFSRSVRALYRFGDHQVNDRPGKTIWRMSLS